jgi:hypothetical protein
MHTVFLSRETGIVLHDGGQRIAENPVTLSVEVKIVGEDSSTECIVCIKAQRVLCIQIAEPEGKVR